MKRPDEAIEQALGENGMPSENDLRQTKAWLDEVESELAAERGEDGGALCEGWRPCGLGTWFYEQQGLIARVHRIESLRAWSWQIYGDDESETLLAKAAWPPPDTWARSAMRAVMRQICDLTPAAPAAPAAPTPTSN